MSEVEDVRPVLEHYSQFDDPVAAFKEKQRLLQVIAFIHDIELLLSIFVFLPFLLFVTVVGPSIF